MFSIIVLAAGKSTRMRGDNKLLVNIRGVPMIRKVVQAALDSKANEVIVVVGWQHAKISTALNGLKCRIVLNRRFDEGQSSSVRAGIAEVASTTDAVLILPGDVALVETHSIDMVIERYGLGPCRIVVAAHKGRSGHPILFDKQLFQEIARINEETYGLKAVVKRHRSEVCLVETGSQTILKDIDTPQDLKNLSTPRE